MYRPSWSVWQRGLLHVTKDSTRGQCCLVLHGTWPPISRSCLKVTKDKAVGLYLAQHSWFNTAFFSVLQKSIFLPILLFTYAYYHRLIGEKKKKTPGTYLMFVCVCVLTLSQLQMKTFSINKMLRISQLKGLYLHRTCLLLLLLHAGIYWLFWSSPKWGHPNLCKYPLHLETAYWWQTQQLRVRLSTQPACKLCSGIAWGRGHNVYTLWSCF